MRCAKLDADAIGCDAWALRSRHVPATKPTTSAAHKAKPTATPVSKRETMGIGSRS